MSELLDLWKTTPWFFALSAGLVGLIVGSFLNVVIYRLPKMMERDWRRQCAELDGKPSLSEAPYNLLLPHSACPHCARPIRCLENIPVLSYLWLGGKCKGCRAPISVRYPIIEMITAAFSAYAAWYFGYGLSGLAAVLLVWAMIVLAVIDFDTQLLPDDITLPLLWLGLLFNLNHLFISISDAVIGAVAGYLALWSVYWLFKLLTGKEGMGYGDFKLLAAIGAWLGWQMLPLVILFSSLVGAVVGIALMLVLKRQRNIPIPFGPYLAGGALIALFWGQIITERYLQLWVIS